MEPRCRESKRNRSWLNSAIVSLAKIISPTSRSPPARSIPIKSKLENPPDVLIALHACDTATDDALAQGIAAGAALLVVSPCCQKELRPQLSAPAVLTDA